MVQAQILIVSEDPKLINLVPDVLNSIGYKAITTTRGDYAIEMEAIDQPDLVILDIKLLGTLVGCQVASRFRESSEVPIIMLTTKAKLIDLLQGFEVGAGDCLAKSFRSKESFLCLRAVFRRSQNIPCTDVETESMYADFQVDCIHRAISICECVVHQTSIEYELPNELSCHSNQLLLHGQMHPEVWEPEHRNNVDYMRAYVHCFCKNLEAEPTNPKMIFGNPRGWVYPS